jgi:energy-coupling factor transporter ATP-binding protein EcfA2
MVERVPFIRIDNISFRHIRSVPMFEGFSTSFTPSSTTLLTGANGAGKTTLMNLIIGILKPDSGSIIVSGREARATPLHEIAGSIAVAPQKAEYQLFLTSVKREIAFGPENLSRPNADELVSNAMKIFALTEFAESHPYDLHPSLRKLLSLASAVAMDTPFLILDEPTSGLSKPEKEILSNVLGVLRSRGKGYILISHDLSFAIPQCRHTIVLKKGKCILDESTASLLERVDAESIMRTASTRIPVSSRLSRLFGHHPVAETTSQFVSFIRDRAHDH